MYLNCSTEKAAANQRLIENCMIEFMQNTLVEEISISSLCKQADVSRKTFYRLFSSKSDVILAMIDHILMDFESFHADPSVGPGEIHRFLAFWKTQKPLLDALIFNSASSLLTDRALRFILVENSSLVQLFGATVPEYSREMMLFYVSGIFSLVQDWHNSGYSRSIDELSAVMTILMQKSPVVPWD